MASTLETVRARGSFERLDYESDHLHVVGWMLRPPAEFEQFELRINDVHVGACDVMTRDDVGEVFPFLPHPNRCGFDFAIPLESRFVEDWLSLTVYGLGNGERLARLSTHFIRDFDHGILEPPGRLMHRVSNCASPNAFRCSAVQAFGDFRAFVARYARGEPKTVLDWGCGCGRLAAYAAKFQPDIELFGCDIDPEAIAWCRANLPSGTFDVIGPHPPTAYRDAQFDVLLGYSVFTHLTAAVQRQWLDELRRILAPGGLALVSVHGEFAASFTGNRGLQRAVRKKGISDSIPDPNLDGIAPDGYYRGTFQTEEYTRRTWSEFAEVVDYVEAAMGHWQDLVVLRIRG